MRCPNCDADATAGAKFCGQCGDRLPLGCGSCGAALVPQAKFCVECGTGVAAASAPAPTPQEVSVPAVRSTPPPLHSGVRDGASPERRLVSVLFCDLVGSTNLSTEIDLEDYREILGAYQRAAAAAVEAADGFVAKYMGDGVLAYFGYPSAHEDDAERAVRAGLAICAAVAGLEVSATALSARVGVATGPVIVGDLIGAGSAQEQGISGETPNLAARLQTLAEPGSVVISQLTHGLVGGLFEYADLGEVTLKGFARPQPALRVLRPNDGVGRFEALRSSRTPLMGREEELDLLVRRWERAVAGEPQVVLISAEPGVGKSRLVSAFRERVGEGRRVDLAAYCAPHGGESAFHPVVRALEARCGFAATDAAEQKAAKLRTFLSDAGMGAEPLAGALISALLSLPADGREPLALSPQRIKDETLRALTPLMLGGQEAPTLTVFEDIHWADPSTLELLRGAVQEAGRGGARRLLLVTFRPEFHPPGDWLGRPDVTSLTLTRLRAADAEAMLQRIADGRNLSATVRREILERAEGVPLYLEEISRAVLDAEGAGTGGERAAVVVPATLQASLAGRLDRLGPARELAQLGAAIGREFDDALLRRVAGWPEAELEDALRELVEADLIFPSRNGEDRGYVFKHALIQDVAYAALLRTQKQALHGRIADALTADFASQTASKPELLARHLAEAARWRDALDAWRRAAVKTFRGGSWREGLGQLGQAMKAVAALPEGPDRDRAEMDLQMITGGVSQGTIGHSAPEALAAYERAYALARSLGDHRMAALAGTRLWIGAYGQGDLETVKTRIQQVLDDLPPEADQYDRSIVHSQICTPLSFMGDFVTAKAVCEATEPDLRRDPNPAPPEYHFMSPLTSSINALMNCLVAMGQPRAWRKVADREERDLDEYGPMSRMITLTILVYSGYIVENWDEIRRHITKMAGIVGEMEGSAYYLELGNLIDMRFASLRGDRRAAEGVDEAMARPSVAYARQHIPRYQMIAGDVHADLGDTARARAFYTESLKGGPFGSQHWLDSEVERRMGDLALAEGDTASAQVWFEKAMSTAQMQSAALFELRAALKLCALPGADYDAAKLLPPICARFDGPCAELEAAQALCGRQLLL